MLHQRNRLPIVFNSGHDLGRVHTRLNDFKSHLASDWLLLFCREYDTEPRPPRFALEDWYGPILSLWLSLSHSLWLSLGRHHLEQANPGQVTLENHW